MIGESDLRKLLTAMSPVLSSEEYIFCSLPADYGDHQHLSPLASIKEAEGLSLVIPLSKAIQYHIEFDSSFKKITLNIHSSLNAVGLTAAVSTQLAQTGISANILAGYFHDHIFVPTDKAQLALNTLRVFSRDQSTNEGKP